MRFFVGLIYVPYRYDNEMCYIDAVMIKLISFESLLNYISYILVSSNCYEKCYVPSDNLYCI